MPGGIQPAQPWHAFAAVYERNGDPVSARRLRYHAARRVTKQSRGLPKLIRLLYGAVVGHGYYPLLAAGWLFVIVLLGCATVSNTRESIVPTRPAAAAAAAELQAAKAKLPPPPEPITAETPCAVHIHYPCLSTTYFVLSSLSPANLTTSTDWVIISDATPWLVIPLWILKIAAWVLAALLLAGFTGLLRKN